MKKIQKFIERFFHLNIISWKVVKRLGRIWFIIIMFIAIIIVPLGIILKSFGVNKNIIMTINLFLLVFQWNAIVIYWKNLRVHRKIFKIIDKLWDARTKHMYESILNIPNGKLIDDNSIIYLKKINKLIFSSHDKLQEIKNPKALRSLYYKIKYESEEILNEYHGKRKEKKSHRET